MAKDKSAKQNGENPPPSRDQMIAEAAYMLAELRQFKLGHELEDWLAAEQMIDAGLNPTRKN